MLRRALLLLLLAAPLGALAQVTFEPAALGKSDCGSTGNTLTINWTYTAPTSPAFVAGSDVFRLKVSQSAGCTDATTKQLGTDQSATALSQSYQVASNTFLSTAGVTCGTTDTVYVCVTLYASDGTTIKGTAISAAIDYDLTPPPVPVSVSVAPGDSALYVSWAAGTGTSVAADHYEVTMTVVTNTTPPDLTTTHGPQSFTGTSGRFGGLVNGVTYQATVVSVSAAGNASLPSSTVAESTRGTPASVSDYWAQYHDQGGLDPGGCAGGPAGVLSLLGLAALARTFRRRS